MSNSRKIISFTSLKEVSERLPGKNFLELGGRPLYRHAIEAVCDSGLFSEIYVLAADNLSLSLPSNVKRLSKPESLDYDSASSNDIIRFVSEATGGDFYHYFHVTAPFTSMTTLQDLVSITLESSEYDSALTGVRVQSFVWKEGRPDNFNPTLIKRTQDIDSYFVENSGHYLVPRRLALKGIRSGECPKFVEVRWPETTDIDYPDEFRAAQAAHKWKSLESSIN